MSGRNRIVSGPSPFTPPQFGQGKRRWAICKSILSGNAVSLASMREVTPQARHSTAIDWLAFAMLPIVGTAFFRRQNMLLNIRGRDASGSRMDHRFPNP